MRMQNTESLSRDQIREFLRSSEPIEFTSGGSGRTIPVGGATAKREKPNWGARKIRERLLPRLPSEVKSGSQHHSRHPRSPWTGSACPAIAHSRRTGIATPSGGDVPRRGGTEVLGAVG